MCKLLLDFPASENNNVFSKMLVKGENQKKLPKLSSKQKINYGSCSWSKFNIRDKNEICERTSVNENYFKNSLEIFQKPLPLICVKYLEKNIVQV